MDNPAGGDQNYDGLGPQGNLQSISDLLAATDFATEPASLATSQSRAQTGSITAPVSGSSEPLTGPSVARKAFCPLCGKTYKRLLKHVQEMHVQKTPQAVYSCGFCSQTFDEGDLWARHILATECQNNKGVRDWLIVNQILGIVRRNIPFGDSSQASKSRATVVDTLLPNMSTGAQPTQDLKAILPQLGKHFPMSHELFEDVIQLLKANKVCKHNISETDYVLSPKAQPAPPVISCQAQASRLFAA